MRQRSFGIIGFSIAVSIVACCIAPEHWWDSLAAPGSDESSLASLNSSIVEHEVDNSQREVPINASAYVQLATYVSPDSFNSQRYPAQNIKPADRDQLSRPADSSRENSDIHTQPALAGDRGTNQLPDQCVLENNDQALMENLPPGCTAGLAEYLETDHNELKSALTNEIPIFSGSAMASQTSFGITNSNGSQHPVPIVSGNLVVEPQNAAVAHGVPQNGNANLAMYNPHKNATTSGHTVNANIDCDVDPHLELYTKTQYPSAVECAQCHQQIFDEWASSSHAYAAISPMFHKFEDTINRLSQGTIGYFCMRCHAPVATTVGLRRDQAIWDGPRVFREGVTCIACHRVEEQYTKTNGERRIEPGGLHDPIVSSGDGKGVELAAHKYKDFYKTKTDPNAPGPGQLIHTRTIKFKQLGQSDYCMSCHQVAVQPGIKLEVVWDQYRASPAYKKGVTCQDCHMGKIPGVDGGYSYGPAAVVNNRVVQPERKHSNHVFYGPGYSIAHPGIFPQNPAADRWSVNQWLQFDWRAGWGTNEFEDTVAAGQISTNFPECWSEVDDRYDARDIVNANLKKLEYKKDLRRQVMENGSKIDGPFFATPPTIQEPLRFHYCVTNTNPGHNMPSGSLGAQPQLWLNVVLIGPDGNRIWESGYLDSNGDLADLHSADVLNRRIPHDDQLFNLQTKFLTTNVKGTDREMYLPINFDIDQLPFLRPAPQPVTVLNHPPTIRMEAHSLPPLGSRKAKYIVPAGLICKPGTYRLSIRLRSRAEPIYFMKFCNATAEMERMMNEWIVDAHPYTVVFEVK